MFFKESDEAVNASSITFYRVYSQPYLSSKLVLVKLREDQGDYFELAHLEGKRLGVRVDYGYGVDFDSVPNLALVEENASSQDGQTIDVEQNERIGRLVAGLR